MRNIYRLLLWLHPFAFRAEFAGEMLWIFDELRETEGGPRLLWDGAVSLFRQRLLRSTYWKVPVACAVGFAQVAFVMGWLSPGPHIAERIAFDQFRGGWSGEAQLEGARVPLTIDFIPGSAWQAEASLGGVPLRVNMVRAEPGLIRFQLESNRAVLQFEGKRARGSRVIGVAKGPLSGTFTLMRD
jgi:hypothetical protein